VEDKLPVTTRIREPDRSTLDSRKGSVVVDPERFRRHLDALADAGPRCEDGAAALAGAEVLAATLLRLAGAPPVPGAR
jgi:hypothetical protein